MKNIENAAADGVQKQSEKPHPAAGVANGGGGAGNLLVVDADSRMLDLVRRAARRLEDARRLQRHERLRVVCRRLNKARHEISQQVDLLCNDLVRAYQEMAQQLNVAQNAAEFAQALQGELDVEGVLRKTMEW